MFKKLHKNEKGFTLAELLIVVAIIGVLVAISIPIFTSQLEKSRDAVTLSNIRAAYAQAQAAYLTGDNDAANHVTVTKSGDVVTAVDVANVASKGTQTNENFGSELPFGATGIQTLDNTPSETNTLHFAYDTNGTVTVTVGTTTPSGSGS